jgi:hypothetical protein
MSRRAPMPINDVVGFPLLLWRSCREHAAAGSPSRDFRLLAGWKPGPAAGAAGPLMISLTQFTPHRLADLFDIWRRADCLGDELVELDGACGVLTYFQPGRRCVGSLSAWTEEGGLAAFVGLPDHREVMRRYRPRGLPLRSAKWWADELRIGPALAAGQRLLDASRDRRVTLPPKQGTSLPEARP